MDTIIMISLSLIGLCFGSFINVIVYRFGHPHPTQPFIYYISITHSHCPHCQTPLTNWQLIPIISWLLLQGHCYSCHAAISLKYLCIELLCLLLFASIAILHGLSDQSILLMLLTSWFMLLALIDIDHYLLPDTLTQPLLWFGFLTSYLGFSPLSLDTAFIGCLLGFFLLWLPATIFKYSKGYAGLGGGDIKLLAALGTWVHYSQLPLLLVIASSLGIIYIISYYLIKKIKIEKVPFGPFILFAGWILLIY